MNQISNASLAQKWAIQNSDPSLYFRENLQYQEPSVATGLTHTNQIRVACTAHTQHAQASAIVIFSGTGSDYYTARAVPCNFEKVWSFTLDDSASVLVASPEVPEDPVISKLESYKGYQANWNGYDAVVPSPKAIDDCIKFFRKNPTTQPPLPMLAGDGEVGLFWERISVKIDIGFQGDGTYAFYVENNGEWFEDDAELAAPLPECLAQALLKFK